MSRPAPLEGSVDATGEAGPSRLAALEEANIARAGYLAALVDEEPSLELLQPSSLYIVCYRYLPHAPGRFKGRDLDRLNRELLMRLRERGFAVPSHATLDGRFALCVRIASHRDRREDFPLLVRETVRLGREVEAEIVLGRPARRGATVRDPFW